MIVDISKPKEPFFEGQPVYHTFHTLRYILEGSGTIRIDNTTRPLHAGTIVFSPANTVQQSFSEDGMTDIVIYLTQFDIGQKDGNKIVVLHDDETKTGYHCFCALYNIFQQRNMFLDHLLKNIYQNLLLFLEGQYLLSTYDPRIQAITKQLQEVFHHPELSVEQVLATQDQNTDYLRRLFKKTHSCTPIQYLNRLRIGKAKKMIEANCLHHYSMTHIAESCGFADAGYFSRVFREHIGLSPTQYETLFPGTEPRPIKK